jgi:hypothetical protein
MRLVRNSGRDGALSVPPLVRNTGPAFVRTMTDPLGPGSTPLTALPFVAIGKRWGDMFSRTSGPFPTTGRRSGDVLSCSSRPVRVSEANREPYSAIEPNCPFGSFTVSPDGSRTDPWRTVLTSGAAPNPRRSRTAMVCGVDVGGGGLVGLITGGSSVPVASRHSPDAAGIIKRRTTARTAAPIRRRRIRSPSRILRIPRSGISFGSGCAWSRSAN